MWFGDPANKNLNRWQGFDNLVISDTPGVTQPFYKIHLELCPQIDLEHIGIIWDWKIVWSCLKSLNHKFYQGFIWNEKADKFPKTALNTPFVEPKPYTAVVSPCLTITAEINRNDLRPFPNALKLAQVNTAFSDGNHKIEALRDLLAGSWVSTRCVWRQRNLFRISAYYKRGRFYWVLRGVPKLQIKTQKLRLHL